MTKYLTMTVSRVALVAALCLCLSSSAAAVEEEDHSFLRSRTLQIPSLDGRWKSTKLSQAQKEAMGLYPPPGEVWPDDPPQENEDGGGTTTIIDTVEEEEEEIEEVETATVPPTDVEFFSDPMEDNFDDEGGEPGVPQKYRRGTFLRYEASKWEKGWADNIEALTARTSICRTLLHGKHQTARTHDFMELLCQSRLDGEFSDWCYYHDHNHYMWYNAGNRDTFEIYIDKTPMLLDGIDPPPLEPIDFANPKFEGVASKFVFKDNDTGEEYVEYIEPLVAQLKFPLAECLDKPNKPLLADFASFVLPPPAIAAGRRTLFYDVGSKDWSRMEYLVEEWAARGAEFEFILSYATTGNEANDAFLTSIPDTHSSHVFRNYFQLVDCQNSVTSPSKVFVPVDIHDEAQPDDYVLLKLDRANADLKKKYVQYILDNHIHVDELIWELNAQGNYVMQEWMDANLQFDEISSMSLDDAYGMLTQLRERGIRAHSWI